MRKCLPVIGFASILFQLSRRVSEKRNGRSFSLRVYWVGVKLVTHIFEKSSLTHLILLERGV